MGRPKGSKNSRLRKAPRSPYQTYSDWYDKYTKGKKAGWFSAKYTEAEFNQQYDLAKKAGYDNPARRVAMSQEYVDRSFERGYRKLYGEDMPDISDKKVRMRIAQDYVDQLRIEQGYSESRAWESFREYFY